MAKRTKIHKKQPHSAGKRNNTNNPRSVDPVNIPVDADQVQHFVNVISVFLKKANGRPVSRADLASKCRGKGQAAYLRALKRLITEGAVAERRNGYVYAEAAGTLRAQIVRISRTFGFAK